MLPRNSHVQFHRFLYFFICQTAGGYGTIKDFFEARSMLSAFRNADL